MTKIKIVCSDGKGGLDKSSVEWVVVVNAEPDGFADSRYQLCPYTIRPDDPRDPGVYMRGTTTLADNQRPEKWAKAMDRMGYIVEDTKTFSASTINPPIKQKEPKQKSEGDRMMDFFGTSSLGY